MKQSLKRFLKHFPDTYRLYGKIPPSLRFYLERLFGTRLNEIIWATRPISAGKDYQKAEDDPHRKFLVEKISNFSPTCILEIGCGTGLNLYLLSKKFPDAELKGIDINSNSVGYGNTWFKQKNISNIKLSVGKADELEFKDKSFDVVFTDAVLIYIGPDKIKKLVKEMIRVAKKVLILNEWHCFEPTSNPLGVYVGHWARDYKTLLKEFVPEEKINVARIPEGTFNKDENWHKYGAVVEVLIKEIK